VRSCVQGSPYACVTYPKNIRKRKRTETLLIISMEILAFNNVKYVEP